MPLFIQWKPPLPLNLSIYLSISLSLSWERERDIEREREGDGEINEANPRIWEGKFHVGKCFTTILVTW